MPRERDELMTLVERAIEKLRRNAAEQRQKPETRPVGSLVVEPRATAPGTPDAPPAAPARRIAINREALREAGYLPETSVDRRFADHYRQIKRPTSRVDSRLHARLRG